MADDPWGKYLTHPDAGQTDPPAASGDDESLTGSALSAAKDFGVGLGKGAVGDVVGAGQLLDPIGQYIAPGATTAIEKAGKGVKDWATGPSASTAESIGRFGGGALPFMFAPEAALGSLAGRAGFGALAGGAQPTESGTAGSHLAGMAGGALGGMAFSPALGEKVARIVQAGGTTAAAEFLARHLGVPPWYAAMLVGARESLRFRPTWLSRLAGQQMKKVPAQASPVAGAAAGQGAGEAQENLEQ
jgi:hypothetical protein